jgi:hypothetical protein
MSNITNTCLYQACTKPSTCTIPSINVYHNLYQTMHQPCTNTCTKLCINHVPVPNCASTMHQTCTIPMHQPCTIPCTIPCANHAHQPCTSTPYHVPIIYHIMPYTPINQDMNQQCISTSRPQPTCTMHPMMCLKSYTKAHKHMPLACSSISPRCNLITQYTKPQVCTITSPKYTSTCTIPSPRYNLQNMYIDIPLIM